MTFEEKFEYCWQEIEAGRKTLEECIRLFPDTPGLAERLRAASRLRGLRAITLRPEVSRRIESHITSQLKQRQHRLQSLGFLRPQWSLASLVIAVIVGVWGFATWVPQSVPGEVPYTIKRSVEEVQVNLTNPDERSNVYADLAEQRTAELEVLVARPNVSPQTLLAALAEATEYTELSLNYVLRLPVERRTAVLQQILSNLERHTSIIATVEAAVPAELAAQIAVAAEAATENQTLASTYYEATTGAAFTPGTTSGDVNAASATPPVTLASDSTPTQVSATATSQPTNTSLPPTKTPSPLPPTATAIPPTATSVPPTKTAQPTNTPSPVPPTLMPSNTPPGQSDCSGNNPHSSRYCTPTPQP